MGTTSSTAGEDSPAPPNALSSAPTTLENTTYLWPDLYTELRDMAAVSFLVYTFGYILDVARKQGGLKGLHIDSEGQASRSWTTKRLARSFTPSEVSEIVQDNQEVLAETYPSEFGADTISRVRQSLKLLQDRAVGDAKKAVLNSSPTRRKADPTGSGTLALSMSRPLTLLEYDDRHQQHEMVYAVCKDDVHRRITLVFRGTENELAFGTNWTTNISVSKVQVNVPAVLKGVVEGDTLWMHSGFYKYVFGTTYDPTDDASTRKYDEILLDIKPLLQQYPDYKLYVTGHSLGAALSTVVAFFLACEPDIMNHPVSCINFASPRVGDALFLEATQYLQQSNRLRLLRVVNDRDSVAMVPMWGFQHVGFQVRLYKDTSREPEITFPKLVDSKTNRFSRTWANSLLASLNFSYDHGDYRERVDLAQEYLKKQNLTELYSRGDLTGF